MEKTILLFLFCCITGFCFAQQEVSGTVTDSGGNPLIGVNIVEKGTSNGTATDFDGNYKLTVAENATLVFSSVGYGSKNVKVNGKTTVNVTLEDGEKLDEVILVGSRTAPRSQTDTSVPIDVLPTKELAATGQTSFDKALQYRIPSFNTVQTPVNDATSLLDPYEIRNMGPSRTLILINGKRKNPSALLYTQAAPGRGETGSDISAIPTDAIKRVEILRDGASAQYGSDAIAGVMNIILKDSKEGGYANLRTGISSKGDGEMIGISVNNGTPIGEDKGFVNYTIDLSKNNLANRPGNVSAAGEIMDFTDGSPLWISRVNDFLKLKPDAGNINGSPENAIAKFLVNGGVDVSKESDLYFNAAYVYKKVNSFANYRTPYWRKLDDYPYLKDFYPNGPNSDYVGYIPTFDGNLNDYNATVGFKSKINEWNIDLAYTTGGNTQTYKVNNTHNGNFVATDPSWVDENEDGIVDPGEIKFDNKYRENSPISFDPGGTGFTHNIANIDISRVLSDKVSIGVGTEFRTETFTVIPGERASYEGGGADSFGGNRPENSGKFNRYNIGGYFDVAYDVTEDLLLNGTVRLENYSDFGDAFVYKGSARYKLGDYALRASYSTGFRAPTLHQIYTQKIQYYFVAGKGIQVGGLFNNVSPQAKFLGVEQLKAENSTNFTAGFGGKITKNFNVTLDYYNIAVKDRIILSSPITRTQSGGTKLDDVLDKNGLNDVSIFANAIDTRTSGIDFVAGYRNIELGKGKLALNLSGNYTLENKREGEIRNPKLVEDANAKQTSNANKQSIINAEQNALFFTSRPQTKWIMGINYNLDKLGVSLNNTYFGKTVFKQDGIDSNLRTEFIPKIVTDLGITYDATEKLNIAFNVNNLLNILPEWKFIAENAAGQKLLDDTTKNKYGLTPKQIQSNLITFNQRYARMTYNGSHFSQLGTLFNLSLNYKF